NMLDVSFAEHYPSEEGQPVSKPEGDSLARFGANLLPVNYSAERQATPIFSYPSSRTRETLECLSKNDPPHPCHGFKMRFANPANGGSPLPTIATFIQLLPAGFRGSAYRSTDATVYCLVEGAGRIQAGKESFEWKQ